MQLFSPRPSSRNLRSSTLIFQMSLWNRWDGFTQILNADACTHARTHSSLCVDLFCQWVVNLPWKVAGLRNSNFHRHGLNNFNVTVNKPCKRLLFKLVNSVFVTHYSLVWQMDAGHRSCTVSVTSSSHLVTLVINFPSMYPNNAIPSFEFTPDGTSIDINTKTKLIKVRRKCVRVSTFCWSFFRDVLTRLMKVNKEARIFLWLTIKQFLCQKMKRFHLVTNTSIQVIVTAY